MMLAPDARAGRRRLRRRADRRHRQARLPDDRAEDLQGQARASPEGGGARGRAASQVDAPSALPIELEGEQVGTTPAIFELVPGALRVRVPSLLRRSALRLRALVALFFGLPSSFASRFSRCREALLHPLEPADALLTGRRRGPSAASRSGCAGGGRVLRRLAEHFLAEGGETVEWVLGHAASFSRSAHSANRVRELIAPVHVRRWAGGACGRCVRDVPPERAGERNATVDRTGVVVAVRVADLVRLRARQHRMARGRRSRAARRSRIRARATTSVHGRPRRHVEVDRLLARRTSSRPSRAASRATVPRSRRRSRSSCHSPGAVVICPSSVDSLAYGQLGLSGGQLGSIARRTSSLSKCRRRCSTACAFGRTTENLLRHDDTRWPAGAAIVKRDDASALPSRDVRDRGRADAAVVDDRSRGAPGAVPRQSRMRSRR